MQRTLLLNVTLGLLYTHSLLGIPRSSHELLSKHQNESLLDDCSSYLARFLTTAGMTSHIPASITHYLTFLDALTMDWTPDTDRNAVSLLISSEVLQAQDIPHEIWMHLLYSCTVGENKDTVLLRVFRLGLIETINVIVQKAFYDVPHYLHMRDKEGNSVMHLAVKTQNPELVALLGDILHAHSLNLLEGDLARNNEAMTPIEEAFKSKNPGIIRALKLLHSIYTVSGEPIPEIPDKLKVRGAFSNGPSTAVLGNPLANRGKTHVIPSESVSQEYFTLPTRELWRLYVCEYWFMIIILAGFLLSNLSLYLYATQKSEARSNLSV